MADRPINAPAADTPCEECGEVLGDWWGVTIVEKREDGDPGTIGKHLTYAPLHSKCWWKRHPDAVDRETERQVEVRRVYELKRTEKAKRPVTDRRVS